MKIAGTLNITLQTRWKHQHSQGRKLEIRALVSDIMMPGVVHAPHGWEVAAMNYLIPDEALCEITGFPGFKSSLCQVEKIKSKE